LFDKVLLLIIRFPSLVSIKLLKLYDSDNVPPNILFQIIVPVWSILKTHKSVCPRLFGMSKSLEFVPAVTT
jgi:hypothetical protein